MITKHHTAEQQRRRAISGAALRVVLALVLTFAAFTGAALAQPPDADSSCDGPRCDRQDALKANKDARGLLAAGDAAIAGDESDLGIANALGFWQQAIDAGLASGAQASVAAQKRIQMYTLSCSSTPESQKNLEDALNRRGALVGTAAAKRALGALGYYDGPINPQISVLYRAGIRKFQRDMAYSDSGDLTPRQFYLLMCNAAQTARDANSQTTLALMYCAGIGVQKSAPWTLAWLNKASTRDNPRATLFLALLHGSNRHCIARNLDKADEYLWEAAQQGDPVARRLLKQFPPSPNSEGRWSKILGDGEVRSLLSFASWPPDETAELRTNAPRTAQASAQKSPAPQIIKPRAKPAIAATATAAAVSPDLH